ncbi:MAG: hypothetical protein R6U19_10305 [Bacteroidales bacterium]
MSATHMHVYPEKQDKYKRLCQGRKQGNDALMLSEQGDEET